MIFELKYHSLARTTMSPFSILLELKMMEVLVTTGAVRCARLHSHLHHQETNNQLSTGGMPFLYPNQQCQSTEGKSSHLPRTCSIQTYLDVSQLCFLAT